jgi:hypothetical protein
MHVCMCSLQALRPCRTCTPISSMPNKKKAMPHVMGTVAQPMLSATQNGSSVSQHIRKRDVCLAAAAVAEAAAADSSACLLTSQLLICWTLH